MTYAPVVIDVFGGLNTRQDPTEVGLNEATVATNVDLGTPGTIATRPGYGPAIGAATNTVTPGPMAYYKSSAGNEYIVATTSLKMTPLQVNGSTNGSQLTPTNIPTTNNAMVTFGNATTQRLYLVDGTSTMRRLDGTTWTSVTLPSVAVPKYAAVYPVDNRLAVAGGQRVWFSKADDPETWSYTAGTPEIGDFVDLDPGDGEVIQAMVTWRDLLIVFKETKFFTFYGTSTDNDGGAIFSYRDVRNSVGVSHAGAACAGVDSVYFAHHDAVFRTTGEDAVSVSDSVVIPVGNAGVTMGYVNRRLYVAGLMYPATDTLVFDERDGTWVSWDLGYIPSFCIAKSPTGPYVMILFTSAGRIAQIYPTYTDDSSTAITWTYTTGLSDLGSDDRKVVRELSVWGKGTVTVRVAVDGGSFDTGTALTLGTSTIAEARQRFARRGRYFQLKFSGTGVASINRVVLRVRDAEEPK